VTAQANMKSINEIIPQFPVRISCWTAPTRQALGTLRNSQNSHTSDLRSLFLSFQYVDAELLPYLFFAFMALACRDKKLLVLETLFRTLYMLKT